MNITRKNLILGAADNYSWPQLEPWAKSIHDSGFTGDVVLLAYRITADVVPNMEKLGIEVYQMTHTDEGDPIDHNKDGLPTQVHKLRNFHMWQFLTEMVEREYHMVAITDTRDVYFQKNPDEFMNRFAFKNPDKIALPSENVLFRDEPWNANMVRRFFGGYVADALLDHSTCNSGTFFGPAKLMASTLLTMYFIQRNFNATGVDQPTLNFLGYTNPQTYYVLDHDSGWACQCGTTLDPTKPQFLPVQVSPPPSLCPENVVINSFNEAYIIVHQWDRVPALKTLIETRYT